MGKIGKKVRLVVYRSLHILVAAALFSMLLSCATGTGCLEKVGIAVGLEPNTDPFFLFAQEEETDKLYRVAGIYRSDGFEHSTILWGFIGDARDVPRVSPFDYCLFPSEPCEESFAKLTRARRFFRDRYAYFAWVDVVVRYESVTKVHDCPGGALIVEKIISAKPISRDMVFSPK